MYFPMCTLTLKHTQKRWNWHVTRWWDRIVQTKYKPKLGLDKQRKLLKNSKLKGIHNIPCEQEIEIIPTTPNWLSPCHKLSGRSDKLGNCLFVLLICMDVTCAGVTVGQDPSMSYSTCLTSGMKSFSPWQSSLVDCDESSPFAQVSLPCLFQPSSLTCLLLVHDFRHSCPGLLNAIRHKVKNYKSLLLTSSFWFFSADWEMQQRKQSASSRSGPSRRVTR